MEKSFSAGDQSPETKSAKHKRIKGRHRSESKTEVSLSALKNTIKPEKTGRHSYFEKHGGDSNKQAIAALAVLGLMFSATPAMGSESEPKPSVDSSSEESGISFGSGIEQSDHNPEAGVDHAVTAELRTATAIVINHGKESAKITFTDMEPDSASQEQDPVETEPANDDLPVEDKVSRNETPAVKQDEEAENNVDSGNEDNRTDKARAPEQTPATAPERQEKRPNVSDDTNSNEPSLPESVVENQQNHNPQQSGSDNDADKIDSKGESTDDSESGNDSAKPESSNKSDKNQGHEGVSAPEVIELEVTEPQAPLVDEVIQGVEEAEIVPVPEPEEPDPVVMNPAEPTSETSQEAHADVGSPGISNGQGEQANNTNKGKIKINPGDTLSEIARDHGGDVDDWADANNIDDPDLIIAGDELNVPGESEVVVVEPGNTLSEIAEDNGTTVAELVDNNPDIDDPDLILPGQVINLNDTEPVRGDIPSPPEPESETIKTPADVSEARQGLVGLLQAEEAKGVVEDAGRNRDKDGNIVKYCNGEDHGWPWCACLASWALKEIDEPIDGRWGWNEPGAIRLLEKMKSDERFEYFSPAELQDNSALMPGDFVFYTRGGAGNGHVGVVTEVKGENLAVTIDGNIKNQLMEREINVVGNDDFIGAVRLVKLSGQTAQVVVASEAVEKAPAVPETPPEASENSEQALSNLSEAVANIDESLRGVDAETVRKFAETVLQIAERDGLNITPQGLAGYMAHISSESNFRTDVKGDKGQANGIFQAHGPRAEGMPADLPGQIAFSFVDMQKDGKTMGHDMLDVMQDEGATVDQVVLEGFKWLRPSAYLNDQPKNMQHRYERGQEALRDMQE